MLVPAGPEAPRGNMFMLLKYFSWPASELSSDEGICRETNSLFRRGTTSGALECLMWKWFTQQELLGHDMSQCSPCWCHSQVSLRTRSGQSPGCRLRLSLCCTSSEVENCSGTIWIIYHSCLNEGWMESLWRETGDAFTGLSEGAAERPTCSSHTSAVKELIQATPETKKNCDLCAPFWPHLDTDKYEASMFWSSHILYSFLKQYHSHFHAG